MTNGGEVEITTFQRTAPKIGIKPIQARVVEVRIFSPSLCDPIFYLVDHYPSSGGAKGCRHKAQHCAQRLPLHRQIRSLACRKWVVGTHPKATRWAFCSKPDIPESSRRRAADYDYATSLLLKFTRLILSRGLWPIVRVAAI